MASAFFAFTSASSAFSAPVPALSIFRSCTLGSAAMGAVTVAYCSVRVCAGWRAGRAGDAMLGVEESGVAATRKQLGGEDPSAVAGEKTVHRQLCALV